MGTLSSGVGLISGLNIQQIVDQLIAVEARPRDALQLRVRNLDAQRTAYADISARITALLARVNSLSQRSTFQSINAQSSNGDILSATATTGAQPGSYRFLVRSLAAAHQVVSRGYADRTSTIGAGTLTIESAQARVDRSAQLATLNGFEGVQRGRFRIIDGDGDEATINLTDALTLDDVVQRINVANTDIRAAVRDEALVLTERNGRELRVEEVDGGTVAADLGFGAGNAAGSAELAGTTLAYLADSTPLAGLHDGRGIRRAAAGNDFRITNSQGGVITVDLSEILKANTRLERLNHGGGVQAGRIAITNRAGTRTEIDLSNARTVADVQAAIDNANAGVNVVISGSRLVLADTTSGTASDLIVEDVNGGTTARDLGLAGRRSTDRLEGRQVLRVDTLRDALLAVNYGEGNDGSVQAAISDTDRRRITLTDTAGGTTGRLTLESLGDSRALEDLGLTAGTLNADDPITGRRILGGVNSVLLSTLNGGRGYQTGSIRVEANGTAADIDLTSAETLEDVIAAINNASTQSNLNVRAGLDATGTRLRITNADRSDAAFTIKDINGGSLAESLGIRRTGSDIRGANLQRQYISELTTLSQLNHGRGVALGNLRLTDSTGRSASVQLNRTGISTVGDVIREINSAGIGIHARINDTGDGLLLEDTANGANAPVVADETGTAARDLNLLGGAVDGRIDGSYEFRLEVGAGESLDDVVRRINSTSTIANASVLRDGVGTNPYRLSIASRATGTAGELILDGAGLDLGFSTISQARDARVLVGSDPTNGVLITSSSNTIENVIDGVTLNLLGVSDAPVEVTLQRNTTTLIDTLKGFVNDFNAAVGRIDALSSYNQDTDEAGPLLGEGAAQLVEQRLFRMVGGNIAGAVGGLTRLSQIGVRIGSDSRLTFDEDKFKEAYEANPDGVTEFFTHAASGVAKKLKDELDSISRDGGVLDRRSDAIGNQKELLNSRITQLNGLLARRRERLTRQFFAMEQALSGLQSQQSALTSLAALSGQATTR